MASISNYGYSLMVEPYCKNCIAFEPFHEMIDISDMLETRINHHIVCANREKCQRIYEHMLKQRAKLVVSDMLKEKRIEDAGKE